MKGLLQKRRDVSTFLLTFRYYRGRGPLTEPRDEGKGERTVGLTERSPKANGMSYEERATETLKKRGAKREEGAIILSEVKQ